MKEKLSDNTYIIYSRWKTDILTHICQVLSFAGWVIDAFDLTCGKKFSISQINVRLNFSPTLLYYRTIKKLGNRKKKVTTQP